MGQAGTREYLKRWNATSKNHKNQSNSNQENKPMENKQITIYELSRNDARPAILARPRP